VRCQKCQRDRDTRSSSYVALNRCSKDGPFVRPFSWLSRSWRPVKCESSPSKFLSRHYDRYPRLERSAILRSLARTFFGPVSTGDRQECGLGWQVLCQQATDGVSTRAENHFAFQATTGLGACRDCQLYVESGEPITLRSADCDRR
jgi:hypothetical protein